jgi:hypothetical protein
MLALTRLRVLCGFVLLVAIAGTGLTADAAERQKPKKGEKPTPTKKPYDVGKKAPAAVGFLAAGTKLTAEQLAQHIDGVIGKKLAAEKVTTSPLTSDAEFLRRVYLDITGKIPTAEQAAAFLDSREKDKRAKLVDQLLADKNFGSHMADIWQALLLPRNSDNRRFVQYYPVLVQWLTDKFNENMAWDQMTREMLTASGEVDKNGPVVFYLANNSADKMTDGVTRMFLGVQLQCAQCHNHPFTDYKQDEYWGMAAFFLKVRPDGNPNKAAKDKTTIKISETNAPKGKRNGLPESAKILPPKFLQDAQPTIKASEPSRPVLAKWLTTKANPFFSRAMVNRLWGQYFGRGIVNPVDDMHDANPATHPELLDDLAKQFAANDFDIKYMVKAIVLSETYQRSSKAAGNNGEAGPEMYARMQVKPLTPEQLYDAITQVTGPAGKAAGPRNKANVRGPRGPRDQFVEFFAAEDGADPTEYQSGIPQVLRLMNAAQLNGSGTLQRLVAAAKSQDETIEKLYLTVLARRPAPEEVERVNKYLAKTKETRREAWAGVLWALMNSSEFALNR